MHPSGNRLWVVTIESVTGPTWASYVPKRVSLKHPYGGIVDHCGIDLSMSRKTGSSEFHRQTVRTNKPDLRKLFLSTSHCMTHTLCSIDQASKMVKLYTFKHQKASFQQPMWETCSTMKQHEAGQKTATSPLLALTCFAHYGISVPLQQLQIHTKLGAEKGLQRPRSSTSDMELS